MAAGAPAGAELGSKQFTLLSEDVLVAWQRKSMAWGPSEQSPSPHQETRCCSRAGNPSFTEDTQKPLVPEALRKGRFSERRKRSPSCRLSSFALINIKLVHLAVASSVGVDFL